MELEIKVQKDFSELWRRQRAVEMLPRAFERQVNKWAAMTIKHIKERIRGGQGFFKREPKELAQRLDYRAIKEGDGKMMVVLGSGKYVGRKEVVYAAIQEYGGVVVPKKRKVLTIPFPGVRHSANMYREFGSFIIRTKEGKGIIAMEVGKRARLKPLFLLSRRAVLPPRRWWSKSLGEMKGKLEEMISDEEVWVRALEMARGGK